MIRITYYSFDVQYTYVYKTTLNYLSYRSNYQLFTLFLQRSNEFYSISREQGYFRTFAPSIYIYLS